MRYIPRTMSTQHPDNAVVPEWVKGEIIEGEDEITEAFMAYSVYGVHEVMWDSEGKDVDTHVVRKLLTRYPDYFSQKILGKDVFLTYRIPNPQIEGADRKVFAETLETIPISYDLATKFYKKDISPVFEVILPFTTSSLELILVARYYEKVIGEREELELYDGVKVKDYLGFFNPKRIEVIPLIEDKPSMVKADRIIEDYIKVIKPQYMRVFLARSDPAMNYGLIPAVISVKIALSKLKRISEKYNIPIFPIIGVGSLPFRGHLNPLNYKNVIDEYKGVYTFTIQSAFRYDYEQSEAIKAIKEINESKVEEPLNIDENEEKILVKIIDNFTYRYQGIIESLANIINEIAVLLPRRRARKLHIGLFGYSRGTEKVSLPRAISFVASLYSLGIPPEILGMSSLSSLSEEEWDLLTSMHIHLKDDLREAIKYYNPNSLDEIKEVFHVEDEILKKIKEDVDFVENNLGLHSDGNYETEKHKLLNSLFLLALKNKKTSEAKKYIYEMAVLRKSLG